MNAERGRLLAIAQAVAPVGGSHSLRVSFLLRELAHAGWNVTVIAPEVVVDKPPHCDSSLLRYMPQEVQIIRTYPGFLRHLAALAGRRRESRGEKHTPSTAGRGRLAKIACPDTFVEWYPFALWAAVRELKRHPYDAIWSSAVPYTCHLVAATAARLTGIPLIVDYGDPWVYDPGHPRTGIRHSVERKMEQWVLNSSKRVTVTTEGTKELYLDRYGVAADKVVVLPMGYFPQAVCQEPATAAAVVRLVYAGTIRTESRNGKPLFEALHLAAQQSHWLRRPILHLVGGVDKATARALESGGHHHNLVVHGWKTYEETVKLLQESDWQVLLGNNNRIQIPGKVFEYIGANRPILNIVNSGPVEEDPVEILLASINYPHISVPNETEEIFSVLTQIANGSGPVSVSHSDTTGMTWKARARVLDEVILDAIKNEGEHLSLAI